MPNIGRSCAVTAGLLFACTLGASSPPVPARAASSPPAPARPASPAPAQPSTFLPSTASSRIVSVSETGQAAARVIVLTQALAVKETGPRQTVARFGEVYAFAPSFFVVHRDEPTLVEFWNLQPDDDHDFMLMDSRWAVMMKVLLPALKTTSFVFTFHQEGVFNFTCVMHQPAMNGQILVVGPRERSASS
jgi:plastocyanin